VGSIITTRKNVADQYNHFKVYRGSGNLGTSGWGVRERDTGVFLDNTAFCLSHPAASGSKMKYVCFRVSNCPTPATDYVNLGIFRQRTSMTGIAGDYENVYNYHIDRAVVQAQGYADLAAASVFIIELPEEVYLQPSSGTKYYLAVYPSVLDLDYDDGLVVDGCAIYTAVGDVTATNTVAPADLTVNDYSISFEMFAEPDDWIAITDGGAVEEENVAWQDPAYCTTGLNVGVDDWTDHDHIYAAGNAVSTANGSWINIDLAGTDNPLPTGTPWDPLSIEGTIFPDYHAYGVRALRQLLVTGTFGADDELTILIHDTDSATAPVIGWQPIAVFNGAGAYSETVDIPQVVRWIQLLETGPTGGTIITTFQVLQLAYHVTDGKFYTDMANGSHPNWVANYPVADTVYRVTAGNLAGGESSPSRPFTNRTNID
jgi:hypothetical protein